jgi:hypothetical protein
MNYMFTDPLNYYKFNSSLRLSHKIIHLKIWWIQIRYSLNVVAKSEGRKFKPNSSEHLIVQQ